MCRRASGHFVAATACRAAYLTVDGAEHLRWYQSSSEAQRGFCSVCGSNLFWKPADGSRMSIMAGTLDTPTGLTSAAHIFVGDKGDYYQLGDEVAKRLDGDHGVATPQE
jgi:hypothetical protein